MVKLNPHPAHLLLLSGWLVGGRLEGALQQLSSKANAALNGKVNDQLVAEHDSVGRPLASRVRLHAIVA